jgi:hypothetical protein
VACTCGARPPDDARFCHKCGRPLYEPEPETAEPEPPPAPVAAAVSIPVEINFHNGMAVRVGFLAAGVGFLASTVFSLLGLVAGLPLPAQLLFQLASLLLVGYFAVYLYRRRTGQSLTPRSGARMGWITGVFCFAIATLFFTFSVLSISSKGDLASVYKEQFKGRIGHDPDIDQAIQILQSPGGLLTLVLLYLVVLFVLFTLIPTLGGALGAKTMEREPR